MTVKTNVPAATETYAAAYSRLAAIADRLKSASAAASIDELVSDLRAVALRAESAGVAPRPVL